jgi:hypothetical protein
MQKPKKKKKKKPIENEFIPKLSIAKKKLRGKKKLRDPAEGEAEN